MRKIIFSKYSNDRNDNYRIRTDILKDEDNNYYVTKIGTNKNSKKHLELMNDMYEKLERVFKNVEIVPNKCSMQQDMLELEYVEGHTLQRILDNFLQNNEIEKFKALVHVYTQKLREAATAEFELTEQFKEVFGDCYKETEGIKSFPVSNIDMLFENIVIQDERWILLDYEWTFMMPVPIDYILFRTINYYESPVRNTLINSKYDLYELFGIKREMIPVYVKMEENFQKYILKGNKPLWQMYEDIGKNVYYPQGLVNLESEERMRRRMQILYDYGNGFEGVSDLDTVIDECGTVVLDIDIKEGIQTIRIDPAERTCIVNINKIIGIADDNYEVKYSTNGESYDNKFVCFDHYDPQIWIGDFRKGVKSMHVEYNIEYINDFMLKKIEELFEKLRNGDTEKKLANLLNDKIVKKFKKM